MPAGDGPIRIGLAERFVAALQGRGYEGVPQTVAVWIPPTPDSPVRVSASFASEVAAEGAERRSRAAGEEMVQVARGLREDFSERVAALWREVRLGRAGVMIRASVPAARFDLEAVLLALSWWMDPI